MKISKLIIQLEKIKNNFGDLPVFGDGDGIDFEINGVQILKKHNEFELPERIILWQGNKEQFEILNLR